jgi:hypothetical protein
MAYWLPSNASRAGSAGLATRRPVPGCDVRFSAPHQAHRPDWLDQSQHRLSQEGKFTMIRIRSGPAAMAISSLALLMSLGGTSYAATQADSSPSASHAARSLQTAWHTLKLTGGWSATFPADSYLPAFSKDVLGFVHLRGAVGAGNLSAAAFQLPPGFRPAHRIRLSIWMSEEASAGGLEIEPNGEAFLVEKGDGSGAAEWSSLDGISFPVP